MPKCTKCGAKFNIDKGRSIQYICQSCKKEVLWEEAKSYEDTRDYIEFNRLMENFGESYEV